MPNTSKPGPRFAVDAGDLTMTSLNFGNRSTVYSARLFETVEFKFNVTIYEGPN